MITTNNEVLYQKLLMLRTFGIVKSNELYTNSIEFGGKDIYPFMVYGNARIGFQL